MASVTSQPDSRKRILLLLGALGIVGITYLCLPRSWFEIPDENAPAAHNAAANMSSSPSANTTPPAAPDVDALRSAAEQTPLDFAARSRYGMALAATGKPAEAEKEFLAATRLAPDSPVAYHNLGIFYHNQRLPGRADAAFRRELELAPANGRAHHYRGLALQDLGKFKPAIRQFRLAIALEPDQSDSYLSLAMLLSRDESEEEVRKLIDEYIRRTGNEGLAYFVLSGAYNARREYKTAARYAELALATEPNKYSYIHNLGKIYSYAREFDKAETHLKRALEIAQDKTGIYIELGMNALNAKQFPASVEYFQQALKANPKKGEIHSYLGRALRLSGDKEAARREEMIFRQWQRNDVETAARTARQQSQQNSASSSQ
jgi:tetratricopeptide (TPR) repeat protein